MFNLHDSIHNEYGICLWTVLTLIVLTALVVIAILHTVNQNKRNSEFNKQLENMAEMPEAVKE